MTSLFRAKSVFVAAVMITASPCASAQNFATAVMFSATVPDGEARPHSWRMLILDPSAVVHAPGQTNCVNGGDTCYYLPSDLSAAYAIGSIRNGNGGAGITVGIVDAFYNPQTEADLAIFSASTGLPACTIASGCLTIVNQTGGAPSAILNAGWAQETNLDVQWVHAIAPNAKILLVTANTNSFVNLGNALIYARGHSDVVSNSYGSNEFSGETSNDIYYASSPVPILFSSGDVGAITQYPCTSTLVTCVGGTHILATATSYRNTESAWAGSGGGCSSLINAPSFQSGYSTPSCGTARGVPDISAIADPYTGGVVYLGTNAGSSGIAGFYIFGGTSFACPTMAALVANIDAARVAAGKTKIGANLAALIYQSAANPNYRYRFYDVTTGSSGFSAVSGWDKATGLGVPLGPSLANYLIGLP